jgi:hypothetical protein
VWLHHQFFQLQIDLFDETISASEHTRVARAFLRDRCGAPLLQLYSMRWWMHVWQSQSRHEPVGGLPHSMVKPVHEKASSASFASDVQAITHRSAREATEVLEWMRSKPLYALWLSSSAFSGSGSVFGDDDVDVAIGADSRPPVPVAEPASAANEREPGNGLSASASESLFRGQALPPFWHSLLPNENPMPPALEDLIEPSEKYAHIPMLSTRSRGDHHAPVDKCTAVHSNAVADSMSSAVAALPSSYRGAMTELCKCTALQILSHIATDALTSDSFHECQALLSVRRLPSTCKLLPPFLVHSGFLRC